MAFFIIILPLWLNTIFSRYAWTDKRTKSNIVRIVLPALGRRCFMVPLNESDPFVLDNRMVISVLYLWLKKDK
jgi:hypothetical protein